MNTSETSKQILILRGIPCSGKSSYARALVESDSSWKRINKDDLRLMLNNRSYNPRDEPQVHSTCKTLLRAMLLDGYNVVLDNTHLNNSSCRYVYDIARALGDVTVSELWFDVPLEECLARERKRSNTDIPEHVIRSMYSTLKGKKLDNKRTVFHRTVPSPRERADKKLPKAIMCDLDGTAALMNGRDPYDASTCDDDLPNTPVITCALAMYRAGFKLVFMSGRNDMYRAPTARFIEKHFGCDVEYELHMRPDVDSRKDSAVKRELYESLVKDRYDVVFVLDDRSQVVDMWRNELGLTTFQVAPGDF